MSPQGVSAWELALDRDLVIAKYKKVCDKSVGMHVALSEEKNRLVSAKEKLRKRAVDKAEQERQAGYVDFDGDAFKALQEDLAGKEADLQEKKEKQLKDAPKTKPNTKNVDEKQMKTQTQTNDTKQVKRGIEPDSPGGTQGRSEPDSPGATQKRNRRKTLNSKHASKSWKP